MTIVYGAHSFVLNGKEYKLGIDPGHPDGDKSVIWPDTQDRSGLLEDIENPSGIAFIRALSNALIKKHHENLKAALRKLHHGKDCIICFEKECVCKPILR